MKDFLMMLSEVEGGGAAISLFNMAAYVVGPGRDIFNLDKLGICSTCPKEPRRIDVTLSLIPYTTVGSGPPCGRDGNRGNLWSLFV